MTQETSAATEHTKVGRNKMSARSGITPPAPPLADATEPSTFWDNDEARRLADATEHAEGSASFRALTECKLRKGKTITIPQRSLINVILRQHLGDAKVASFLFNHDSPSLLDLPI